MGQKQNVNKTIIEDPIEKIWKDNPKIPFMQSKEILAFGYKKGVESKELIVESKELIVESKELIDHAQNKIDKKRPKTDQQITNKLN